MMDIGAAIFAFGIFALVTENLLLAVASMGLAIWCIC
jgi:hypothetical protein